MHIWEPIFYLLITAHIWKSTCFFFRKYLENYWIQRLTSGAVRKRRSNRLSTNNKLDDTILRLLFIWNVGSFAIYLHDNRVPLSNKKSFTQKPKNYTFYNDRIFLDFHCSDLNSAWNIFPQHTIKWCSDFTKINSFNVELSFFFVLHTAQFGCKVNIWIIWCFSLWCKNCISISFWQNF